MHKPDKNAEMLFALIDKYQDNQRVLRFIHDILVFVHEQPERAKRMLQELKAMLN